MTRIKITRGFHRPVIQVRCPEKDEWIDEQDVEIMGIEEDIQGRDVLSFKCPLCNQQHKSLRRG